MATNELWFTEILPKVFTVLKVRGTERLKTKYPTIKFVKTDSVNDVPVYPTVYLTEDQYPEIGNTIDNRYVNAVEETIQADVETNTNENDVRIIMNEIVLQMKKMRFSVSTVPIYMSDGTNHRAVARFIRTFGADDTFLM